MIPLLLLAHRLPYPPNRGDKIRSYHLMKWLSQYFDIYLGTFYDDPKDEKYIDDIRCFTKEIFAVPLPLNKFKKIKKGLVALVKGKPVTVECFRSKSMQTWVNNTVTNNRIAHAFVICSSMAPYVLNKNLKFENKIIDLIDLDSDKWFQYYQKFSGIMSLIYLRESKKLFKFEKEIAEHFDSCLFVSQVETTLFNEKTYNQYMDSTFSIQNGIDSDYFCSQHIDESNLQERQYLVFTGTMNSISNVESILWFINTVWLRLHQAYPSLELFIVGNTPVEKVLYWHNKLGITVTGFVSDVRPFLKYCIVAVAPMILARGVQNKVLEAMAMGKSLVLTKKAAEGVLISEPQLNFVTNDDSEMLVFLSYLIDNPAEAATVGKLNRQFVLREYSWEKTLEPLRTLLS